MKEFARFPIKIVDKNADLLTRHYEDQTNHKITAHESNRSLINGSGMKVFIARGKPWSPKSINRADNRMRAGIIDFVDFSAMNVLAEPKECSRTAAPGKPEPVCTCQQTNESGYSDNSRSLQTGLTPC